MPDTAITIAGTFKRFVLQDWTAGKDVEEGYFFAVGENGEPVAVPAPEGQSLQYVKDGPNQSVEEGCVGGNHATGMYSHAEGDRTSAKGEASHAEGSGCGAEGKYSHAEGLRSLARGRSTHAFGEYNIPNPGFLDNDTRAVNVEIVGNGTSANSRSNARTLDWHGNEWLAGTLKVSRDPRDDMEVATKKYVDDVGGKMMSGTKAMNIGITQTSGNLYRSELQTIVIDRISPAEGKVFVGNVFPQKDGYPVWASNVKTFENANGDVCISFYVNSGGFRNSTSYAVVWTLLECEEKDPYDYHATAYPSVVRGGENFNIKLDKPVPAGADYFYLSKDTEYDGQIASGGTRDMPSVEFKSIPAEEDFTLPWTGYFGLEGLGEQMAWYTIIIEPANS